MGVYIKGMKMPKNCGECWETCLHVAINCEAKADPNGGEIRRNDCPLIEVSKPHGRLIDVDRLIIEDYTYCEAPTVIEREVKE